MGNNVDMTYQNMAVRYDAYISEETESIITVEANEENIRLKQDIEAVSGKKVIIKIENPDIIYEKIKKLNTDTEEKGEFYISDIFGEILKNAVRNKASDIHIEPFDKICRIRVRIDGDLVNRKNISMSIYPELSAFIKLKSGMDIAEKKIPQDGRINENIFGMSIDIRVSSIPTINGEKIVMRLLNKDTFIKKREELGFSERAVEMINSITSKSKGMLIVCGSTGSGKTTTVYSILNELIDNKKNITTIENPVEYKIDGINQIQINEKTGLSFDKCLKSVLRQDPDIIMVGEIRDKETAETAIRAAITGHLVITTLHTENAISAIIRLEDMGIKPYLISASLSGIISQKLIRKKYTSLDNIIENEHDNERKNKVHKTGDKIYSGRTAVYEIIVVNDNLKECIRREEGISNIKKEALKSQMITFEESCYTAIKSGIIDEEECKIAGYI